MNKLKLALVSCGFLGCSPFAPGTVGTLGGVLLAWLLAGTELFPLWALVSCAVIYAVARPLGRWAEEYAGEKDPGFFVLDEVLGYMITVLWLRGPSLLTLVVAFFVFRLFDIIKPPPGRRCERIPGGDGILLDDLVAGIWGLVLLMVPARLLIEATWNVTG